MTDFERSPSGRPRSLPQSDKRGRGRLPSPPKSRRRQFDHRAVWIVEIEARAAARPRVLANDGNAALQQMLAPHFEISRGDGEGEMQPAAAVMPWDRAASVDGVGFGRAGLKHQKDAAAGDLEGDETRGLEEGPEPEQVPIKGRCLTEIARIKRGLQKTFDRRRLIPHFRTPLAARVYQRASGRESKPGPRLPLVTVVLSLRLFLRR